jgi:hypothetical protein
MGEAAAMVTISRSNLSLESQEISRSCGTPSVTATLHPVSELEEYDGMRTVTQEVTVTLGEVPVTPATEDKIVWQAGMSKRMSHVRGYVPLQVKKSRELAAIVERAAGKSEKHRLQAGMYSGMNRLPGYVVCRDRDDWDF